MMLLLGASCIFSKIDVSRNGSRKGPKMGANNHPKRTPFGLPLGSWALIFLTFGGGGGRFGVVFWYRGDPSGTPKVTVGAQRPPKPRKKGSKIGTEKGRSQEGPKQSGTFRAEATEGGGKPHPLGFGGSEDLKDWKKGKEGRKEGGLEDWKKGRKGRKDLHADPRGRRIKHNETC